MATEKSDPFKDLLFSGAPSEYRAFRRKILLSVAASESKHLKLVGPRILQRLSGEAWKATEHLSVSELRGDQGWLAVLKALDSHYRYLPETELNECVDEFLFHLRRRPMEGATAFTSRFRAGLNRLETLVAADKAASRKAKKKRKKGGRRRSPTPSPSSSSASARSSSDFSSDSGLTKKKIEEQDRAAASADQGATEAAASKKPKTVGSLVADGASPKRRKDGSSPRSRGYKGSGYGSHRADEEHAHKLMMRSLARLEEGHLRLKPIFPEIVLGHLYMKKYGLSRDQRTAVVRATGGSSKLKDIERIMRASDFEERRPEGSRRPPGRERRESAMEADADSGTLSDPSLGESEQEAHEATLETEDEETILELQDAYETQKKAKANVRRFVKTYRDSRKKVKEIRRSRQPYMPVVAIPPPGDDGGAAAVHGQMQPRTGVEVESPRRRTFTSFRVRWSLSLPTPWTPCRPRMGTTWPSMRSSWHRFLRAMR